MAETTCSICGRDCKSALALKSHLQKCEKEHKSSSSQEKPGGGGSPPPKQEEEVMAELKLEDIAQVVVMSVAGALKQDRESQGAAKENPVVAQAKAYCEQFPGLCKKIEKLEKEAEESTEQSESQHKTAKEYLDCPTCGNAIIKAAAKRCAEDPKFCGDFQKVLDEQGFALSAKEKAEEPSGGLF